MSEPDLKNLGLPKNVKGISTFSGSKWDRDSVVIEIY
jgi:hypothetical protein